MVRIVVKNGHLKDMCSDEIGLCARNIGSLGSIMDTIGRVYMITQEKENLHFGLLQFRI